MKNKHTLNLSLKPEEFFHEKIQHAKGSMQAEFSDETLSYMVHLLIKYITPPKIALSEDDCVTDVSLVELLKKAMESSVRQRYQILRHLADTSLYMSGFFQDYFNRKLFDIDYYVTMGQSAYNHLAVMSQDIENHNHMAELFGNLSNKFIECVDIIATVSEDSPLDQNQDILAVYDRWTKTNSKKLYHLLEEAGITPIPSFSKTAS